MSRRTRTYARRSTRNRDQFGEMIARLRLWARNVLMRAGGLALILIGVWLAAALATFSISDPSFNTATDAPVQNLAGAGGAALADMLLQLLGGAAFLVIPPMMIWGGAALLHSAPEETPGVFWRRCRNSIRDSSSFAVCPRDCPPGAHPF